MEIARMNALLFVENVARSPLRLWVLQVIGAGPPLKHSEVQWINGTRKIPWSQSRINLVLRSISWLVSLPRTSNHPHQNKAMKAYQIRKLKMILSTFGRPKIGQTMIVDIGENNARELVRIPARRTIRPRWSRFVQVAQL